jgi:hypothetical protein
MSNYANKLKDSLYWWLGRKRPFVINDEYRLELLYIDKENNSAKIRITNLKTGFVEEAQTEVADEQQC